MQPENSISLTLQNACIVISPPPPETVLCSLHLLQEKLSRDNNVQLNYSKLVLH